MRSQYLQSIFAKQNIQKETKKIWSEVIFFQLHFHGKSRDFFHSDTHTHILTYGEPNNESKLSYHDHHYHHHQHHHC